MNSLNSALKRRIIQAWIILASGVFLFILGLSLPVIFPGSTLNFKWIIGLGVSFSGCGVILVARYTLAQRSPEDARRTMIGETDERTIAIRNKAGNAAFMLMFLLSGLGLIVYSAISQGQEFDILWLYLALVVIVPIVFYVGYLVSLQKGQ